MEIEVSHKLSKEEAYKRINSLLFELQKQYAGQISSPVTSWNAAKDDMTFSVNIMGNSTSGHVYLLDKSVKLKGELPGMMVFFSGQIEGMIRQKLTEILA